MRFVVRGGGGGGRPCHVVINGENLHALQLLTFTHRGKFDAIYIDPPYNSGSKDWKYNNDYVDNKDSYRHSKWLAFMERRLKIAKDLLNPDGAVLIISIDANEYLRLGLLLEQIFPEVKGQDASMQMISSVVNGGGISKGTEFSRIDEYIFFLWFGNMKISGSLEKSATKDVHWHSLRRTVNTRDTGSENQFYPIYVNRESGLIEDLGDPLPNDASRTEAPDRDGCISVFPVQDDGTEMMWALTPSSLRKLMAKNYIKIGKYRQNSKQPYVIRYFQKGVTDAIDRGEIEIIDHCPHDGSVIARYKEAKGIIPKTLWRFRLHNAGSHGTRMNKALLPDRKFPYPKSVYAVEDCLRIFLVDKPDAKVLDFFAGSGTTCHAVMKLNRSDNGRRQSVSVTNNEVGPANEKELSKKGFRPGDQEWESLGICDHITIPRITAAIRGKTSDGKNIAGMYKKASYDLANDSQEEVGSIVDDFPICEGFSENVVFFKLTYETKIAVEHSISFSRMAPLLWIRSGAAGCRIDELAEEKGWGVADTYGIIEDLDMATAFAKAIKENPNVKTVFAISADHGRIHMLSKKLQSDIRIVRLWESYLSSTKRGE